MNKVYNISNKILIKKKLLTCLLLSRYCPVWFKLKTNNYYLHVFDAIIKIKCWFSCAPTDPYSLDVLAPIWGRGLLGCVVALHIIIAERYVERFTVTPCSEMLVATRTTYRYAFKKNVVVNLVWRRSFGTPSLHAIFFPYSTVARMEAQNRSLS